VIIVVEVDRIDADLAAGLVACPGCATALRPWSYARVRTIRQLDGPRPAATAASCTVPGVRAHAGATARVNAAAAGGCDRGDRCRPRRPGAGSR
jgi:hypothetical protein